ncbi:hemolymph lipopolysaccharide-binding protein [Anabrus simplex]|uniref:hemolymph lipopolysaccharide-binding protein n=1 Tax=Anabrus simplex TaxID=316456 RepID=UPI0035A35113
MMNELLALTLFILHVIFADASQEVQCSPHDSAQRFTFLITSIRNETGHRVVQAELQNQADITFDPGDPITLGVTHSRSLCGGMEMVQLKTVISVSERNVKSMKGDYELFPGQGYYKLHTNGMTWDEARITCYNEGAQLMVINSEAEANVVKEFFSRHLNFRDVQSSLYVFIGFHDKFAEGHFVLINGEPLDSSGYTNWAPGQPNGSHRQNFGAVDNQGLLHDITDGEKYGFICEKE